MATFGQRLSDAIDALLPRYKAGPHTPLGIKQRLAYIRGPKTGASDRRLIQLLGVKPDTLGTWLKGGKPSKQSADKINEVYLRFLRINNRDRILRVLLNDKVKITGPGAGDVHYFTISRTNWRKFVSAYSRSDIAEMDRVWSAWIDQIDSNPEDWWNEPEELELV